MSPKLQFIGSFDEIIQSSLRLIRQISALSESDGDAQPDPPALHLGALFNSLISGIPKDHGLLAVQPIAGEVRSCTLAAMVSTEWKRPFSLSTPMWTLIPKHH